MLKRLDISVPDRFEEPLLGLAERLGVTAFSSPCIIDSCDDGEESYRFTGTTVVSFVFSSLEQDSSAIEAAVKNWLAEERFAETTLSMTQYSENEDWMRSFREYFQPLRVGNRIVVRPPWTDPILGEEQGITILIDPGMAFGTGTHESTRICLSILEKLDIPGKRFLDLGAGSGILSFYLLKREAAYVEAVELDGAAVENLKKNAELNRLLNALHVKCIDLNDFEPDKQFDGIVANLTSAILLDNLARFHRWLKPSGWAVLSGINSTNAPNFRIVLSKPPWERFEEHEENEWRGFFVKTSK